MAETVKNTPDICNRLRGIYRIPITDGLGATGGGEEPENPDEFVRRFPSVPIQERAADLISEMLDALYAAQFLLAEKRMRLPQVDAAIAKATGAGK